MSCKRLFWAGRLAMLATPGLFLTNNQHEVLAANSSNTQIADDVIINQVNKQPNIKILSSTILAQTQLPNLITPDKSTPPIRDPQPEPVPPVQINPERSLTIPALSDIPGTIIVKDFKFEGNEAFDDDELREKLAHLTGKPISFAELLKAEKIIRNEYTKGCLKETEQAPLDTDSEQFQKETRKYCYINSGAFIPAQEIGSKESAVITMKVVEGTVENIEISGLKKLQKSYVRNRIQRGISKPLEREKLLNQLQILQLNPLIQNLSAELAAGTKSGQSILEISVTEADPFFTELFIDNARNPSVGSFRRGISFSEGNLFGFGDRLGGEYVNTDGSNAVNLSYSVPITASNTTLDIRGGGTATEVVEEPFDRADILGNSFNFEFGVRQPVYRSPTTEIAVGLSGSRQESNTEVMGENFQLSPGADENGETRISALRFDQEYTKRTLQDVFAVRSQFNIGLDILDSSINENPIPDSRFFAWRGQGQYVRRIGQNSLILARSDLQLATGSLVPLEQFSVGGIQSVRGYRQDALLTDNGFFTSAEVRLPIYQVQSIEGLLSVVPFIDFGIGWNDDSDNNSEENVLMGIGFGVQWQMGDGLNARLDYGIALTDVDDTDNTLQENGVYFSLSYSPF